MVETISIDQISTDGTQSRAELNNIVIDEYADAYEEGVDLPAIDVYFDEETYWLADGFHRLAAVHKLGRDSITAKVHEGGKREAILHAVGANENHGLRRTNADRRNAVRILLMDPEWRQWNNSEIARQCHVSEHLVRIVLKEIQPQVGERVTEKKKATRGGTEYEIRTGGIGSAKRKPTAATTVDAERPVSADTTELDEPPSETVSSTPSKMESKAAIEESTEALPASAAPETASEVQVATDYKSVDMSDVPPESPLTVEVRPDPDATTLPVEVAEQYSVEDAWAWAGRVEREAFVVEHRSELKKIIAKVERKKAESS